VGVGGWVSMINLLNLYNFWWMPRIELVVQIMSFGNRLMPRILGLVLLGFMLFFEVLRKDKNTAKGRDRRLRAEMGVSRRNSSCCYSG